MNELARVTPDYRNNGQFQFVTGYTGGFAAPVCVHLSFDEVEQRLQRNHPGKKSRLIDNGSDLVLVSAEENTS